VDFRLTRLDRKKMAKKYGLTPPSKSPISHYPSIPTLPHSSCEGSEWYSFPGMA